MRSIGSKKLSLNKETLRTLSGLQLEQVAGASGVIRSIIGIMTGEMGCVIVTGRDTDQSMGALGCVPSAIPDLTPHINPSLLPGAGGH